MHAQTCWPDPKKDLCGSSKLPVVLLLPVSLDFPLITAETWKVTHLLMGVKVRGPNSTLWFSWHMVLLFVSRSCEIGMGAGGGGFGRLTQWPGLILLVL